MIYVNIDKEGQKELKAELKTTQNVKWYRRLKALDLSADGYSAPKIAEVLDLHGTTIRGHQEIQSRWSSQLITQL